MGGIRPIMGRLGLTARLIHMIPRRSGLRPLAVGGIAGLICPIMGLIRPIMG